MATLGDILKIEQNITNSKLKAVKALHHIAYGSEGQPRMIRKNLRKFEGFHLDKESDEYVAKLDDVKTNLQLSDLTAVCHVLDLDYEGNHDEVLDRVCSFLNDLSIVANRGETEDEEQSGDEEDWESLEDEGQEEQNPSSGNMRTQTSTQRRKCDSFALTFRDVEDTIRTFSGKDNYPISKWIEDFEEIAEVTGWNGLQKLIFAKKSLSGLAKLYVQSEKGIKSWAVLKKKLLSEFEVRVSSAQIHKLLMSRKKESNETVQEYVLVMREIGSRAMIESEVIIQYIIDGIQDESASKIVLYGAKNFAEFKEKVKLYDEVRSKKSSTGSFVGSRTSGKE